MIPRQVGVCLKHLPSDTEQGGGGDNGDDSGTRRGPRWHSGNVPWQRVINSKGAISPRYVQLPATTRSLSRC